MLTILTSGRIGLKLDAWIELETFSRGISRCGERKRRIDEFIKRMWRDKAVIGWYSNDDGTTSQKDENKPIKWKILKRRTK